MTVNSKEENSQDFCPNYVQEFGLWTDNKTTQVEKNLNTVNSKEEKKNSQDFCPNYVQEFGLWTDNKTTLVEKKFNTEWLITWTSYVSFHGEFLHNQLYLESLHWVLVPFWFVL